MTQRLIYQAIYPYFITTNIKKRIWFFDNEKYAISLFEIVIEACKKKDFILYAFVILADHVHLLVKNNGRALEKARCEEEGTERTFCKVRCESREEYGFSRGTQCGPSPVPQRGLSSISTRGLSPVPQRGLSSPRGYTVSDLMQSIKGNFSRQIHIGELWQSRFNSRLIDNEKRLSNTFQYIKYNHLKHGLSDKYGRYPYQFIDKNKINALFF